jgi:translation elongation factor EF-Tu-like GTPase
VNPVSDVRFVIEDKFNIRGRRPVVVGRLHTGKVVKGQQLTWRGQDSSRPTRVICIEKFRQFDLPEVQAGPESVGLELEGIPFESMAAEDILTDT